MDLSPPLAAFLAMYGEAAMMEVTEQRVMPLKSALLAVRP
jgi:hypothetical protein